MIPTSFGGTSTQPIRLMVVDDDHQLRSSIVRLLTKDGYEVISADSVDNALSMLMQEGEVSLILSDIDMPGRNGQEFLGVVRSRYPDIAVLMLSGQHDVDVAVECLKSGARDYLTKPVQTQELLARVARALEDRDSTLEIRRLRAQYLDDLEREVKALSVKNQAMFLAQVQMAVTMLEAKHAYTRGHSGRVAGYAAATARYLGLPSDLVREIHLGGELHDIGKIGTRDAVLNKPGKLTDDEFAEIRRHTIDGENMLSPLREQHPEVLEIVRSHHEHLDGKGFPDGLKADSISLPVRIVSVADSFDAMTSGRTYGTARTFVEGFAELRRCSATQFDAEVVEAFILSFPEEVLPLE